MCGDTTVLYGSKGRMKGWGVTDRCRVQGEDSGLRI